MKIGQHDDQALYDLYVQKIDEYSSRFHEPYLHAGEVYPDTYEARIDDIQRHLDAGDPRPWVEFPDDCYI